jgi:hypothetical protein
MTPTVEFPPQKGACGSERLILKAPLSVVYNGESGFDTCRADL